jgi:hypothetical protein
MASQTCNLYNPDFQKIPSVEWVGANKLEGKLNSQYEFGRNPRILHCQASADGEPPLSLEVHIQARFWTPRTCLVSLNPGKLALRDQGLNQAEKVKDTFVGWLARSYTRLELSDEFNNALKRSKLAEVLEDKLRIYRDDLYGIFLEISSDSDDADEAPLTAQQLAKLAPPYLLEITLVTYRTDKIDLLKRELVQKVVKDLIRDPDLPKGQALDKQGVTRQELAKRNLIRINADGLHVFDDENWSVRNLNSSVRYSFIDHLSESTYMDSL